jgi:hypothetical protein
VSDFALAKAKSVKHVRSMRTAPVDCRLRRNPFIRSATTLMVIATLVVGLVAEESVAQTDTRETHRRYVTETGLRVSLYGSDQPTSLT